MTTSLQQMKVEAGIWTNIYLVTAVVVGTRVKIQNTGKNECEISESLIAPALLTGHNNLLKNNYLTSEPAPDGLWVYSRLGTTLQVTVFDVGAVNGSSSIEYGLSVQRGLVNGVSVIHKFGRNPDIDTSDGFRDLWNDLKVDHYTGFDAVVADVVEVVSTDITDTAAGVGAQSIQLIGLGSGLVEQTEILTLNGTTPVVSVNEYIRLDRAIILQGGSSGGNVGVVSAYQQSTPAVVFFNIAEGANRTTICAYTVPFGKLGYIKRAFLSLARKGTASVEVKGLVRFPGSVFQTVEWFSLSGAGSSSVTRVYDIPLIGVPAGSDIKFAADTDTNNIGVAGGFEMLLVDV